MPSVCRKRRQGISGLFVGVSLFSLLFSHWHTVSEISCVIRSGQIKGIHRMKVINGFSRRGTGLHSSIGKRVTPLKFCRGRSLGDDDAASPLVLYSSSRRKSCYNCPDTLSTFPKAYGHFSGEREASSTRENRMPRPMLRKADCFPQPIHPP